MTSTNLIDKLNPTKHGFSPRMAAIVGAILGHDYGARDGRGGRLLAPLSITSDGFVLAASTAHDTGAFIGSAADLERNLSDLLDDADLTADEKSEWKNLYDAAITDWRGTNARRRAS